MSIESAVVSAVVSVGIWYAIIQNHQNNLATLEKRQLERMEKIMDPIRKKRDKKIFITKFIDEIPELSYYEAAQLKNKLGDIYLEWNDE